jgi:hypothetical protein
MTAIARTARRRRSTVLVARVVTEASSPTVCAILALFVVAVHTSGSGAGAAWGGFAAVLVAGVPMGYITKGVRAGKWSDHHIAERGKRSLPLLVAIASVTVAGGLLLVAHAPRELVALIAAMLVGLFAVLAITHWWKVSIHSAVAGGLLGVLVVLFGANALIGTALLAAAAWSRTVLDAHTWPQVVTGAAVGVTIVVTVFPALA